MSELFVFYQSLLAIVVMIGVGIFLGKRKIINAEVNAAVARILLSVAMPAALFIAFPDTFDHASWRIFLQAVLGGLLVILLAIIVSRLVFQEKYFKKNYHEHQFAFIFNNASFLGYPLTLALFGKSALVPYSGFILVFNLFLFSYGVWLFNKKLSWKNIVDIFLNPNILAVVLGLVFFLNSWSVPNFLGQSLSYLAALTTPLSLLSIGFLLSQINGWKKLVKKTYLFITCALQLTLMPLLTYLILSFMGSPKETVQVLTLIQALPTATSLAIFAERYRGDKVEASELVMISTLMSAVTLPVVMFFLLR